MKQLSYKFKVYSTEINSKNNRIDKINKMKLIKGNKTFKRKRKE